MFKKRNHLRVAFDRLVNLITFTFYSPNKEQVHKCQDECIKSQLWVKLSTSVPSRLSWAVTDPMLEAAGALVPLPQLARSQAPS